MTGALSAWWAQGPQAR